MDTDLRELERRWRSAGDQESRDALERAWLRAGLGWHGEAPFPGSPVPVPEVRGVYRLKDLETQFIYAPGGETECDHLIFGFRGMPRCVPKDSCPRCSGTCRRLVRPFYAGRFPVTWGEWCGSERPIVAPAPAQFPVVGVPLEDVRAFCNDAGLRLLTIIEWNWLAFGGLDQPKRTYPWGNDHPTIDRCAPRSLDDSEDSSVGAWPVVKDSGEPFRDAGRSWCGAQDLVGNVSQWVDMPGSSCAIMGGSFRSRDVMKPHHDIAFGGSRAMDHVGFRVALSVPPVGPATGRGVTRHERTGA